MELPRASLQPTHISPLQCVCLPWPCLSVAEGGGVITSNQGLHQGLHAGLINLILGRRRSKRVVEGEEAVWAKNHLGGARHLPQTHFVVVEDLPWQQGPDSHRHPDTHLGHGDGGQASLASSLSIQLRLESENWQIVNFVVCWRRGSRTEGSESIWVARSLLQFATCCLKDGFCKMRMSERRSL